MNENAFATLTIRRLTATDAPALERIAALDSKPVPGGDLLGAEVEGTLLAAVAVDGRDAVADPFSRSGELLALLRLRAEQLGRRRSQQRRGLRARARGNGHASAPAPPGLAGRLLSLPRGGL